MKDTLGGNSLTIALFNIQNGDVKQTSLTLNYLKMARNIVNFPIINDSKSIELMRKLRAETLSALNSKGVVLFHYY